MAKPVDVAKYLSKRYLARKPSAIRKLVQEGLSTPGMISLAGGLPNPQCFPFEGLSATLRGGQVISLAPERVKQALQYSPSYGLPPLLAQLDKLQKGLHSPLGDFKVCVGTGSQSLLARCFDMLLNPGDTLLIEAPSYPGSLAALRPWGPKYVPLPIDANGLVPDLLRKALEGWEGAGKPKVLYTIPVGQNPSGATLSVERKAEVYKICQQHDVIIIEDDPYYFLYLGEPGTDPRTATPPPSFLSMDTDGRVIRFDSLSKVLSSGFRLGFVTGNPGFVEQIQIDIQCSELHTSGVSQALVAGLLETWGTEGWERHVAETRAFYAERRGKFLALCDKHLKGLAEWDAPAAGMFVWFRLLGIEDSFDLISKRAKQEKVLLVPGRDFDPLEGTSPYVRASYSIASDEQMDQALQRLARLLTTQASKL